MIPWYNSKSQSTPQRKERKLLPGKKLFKHNLSLLRAQQRAAEHLGRSLLRLKMRLADHHALARRQSTRLDDDRSRKSRQLPAHLIEVIADRIRSRRNLMPLHKLFRK